MKIFIFLCLAFVAVQVSSAPTNEDSPTIIILSSDGPQVLTPLTEEKHKEIPMENVAEKIEEKQADKTQVIVSEQPAVKVEEQPAVKVEVEPAVKIVEQPAVKVVEQPAIKVVEQPAVKVEEVKQENPAEKSEKIEIKDEKIIVAPHDVVSDKQHESEKKNEIDSQSSMLYDIFNMLFGDSHPKQKPSMIQISIEKLPAQSNLMEIAQEDNDDDDDIEVSFLPADAYQSYQPHREERSMFQPFYSMFNPFRSMPSIFGYGSPIHSSPEPRVRFLGDSRLSRFFA